MKYLLFVLLLLLPASTHAMQRPVFSFENLTMTNSAARYVSWDTGSGAVQNAAFLAAAQPVAIAGTVSGLHASLSATPGVGNSYTFTLYKNTAAQALTCTISNPATSCDDLLNSVSVSAGDTLAWQTSPTGTPAAATGAVSAVFTGTSAGETSLSGGTAAASTTGMFFYSMYGLTGNATESTVTTVISTPGVIDKLYMNLSATTGAGNGYTGEIYKNGSATGVKCTISGAGAIQCNDPTNSVSVAAGDTVSMSIVNVSTPSARNATWGFRFTPTTDGESPVWGTASVTGVNRFFAVSGNGTSNLVEATTQVYVPIATVFKNFYWQLATAPGGATSRGYTFRINSSNGTVTSTISGANTTGNDIASVTGHSDSTAVGDLVSWQHSPVVSTPAASISKYSITAYINPGTPTAGNFSQTIFFSGSQTIFFSGAQAIFK